MINTVEAPRNKLLSYIKINCTDQHILELIDKYYYSLEELKFFVRLIDDVKATTTRNFRKLQKMSIGN